MGGDRARAKHSAWYDQPRSSLMLVYVSTLPDYSMIPSVTGDALDFGGDMLRDGVKWRKLLRHPSSAEFSEKSCVERSCELHIWHV